VRDEAAPGQQVPFFEQQTLGGSHTLRGFRNYRFRGERVALLQAEYRWEANPAVELALFVDSGMAASPGQSLDLDEFRTSWGAAIRFKAPETFLVRVEWAHSDEGNRFFARLSPAW
jgi:outer membrane protein assembly factor BamA